MISNSDLYIHMLLLIDFTDILMTRVATVWRKILTGENLTKFF